MNALRRSESEAIYQRRYKTINTIDSHPLRMALNCLRGRKGGGEGLNLGRIVKLAKPDVTRRICSVGRSSLPRNLVPGGSAGADHRRPSGCTLRKDRRRGGGGGEVGTLFLARTGRHKFPQHIDCGQSALHYLPVHRHTTRGSVCSNAAAAAAGRGNSRGTHIHVVFPSQSTGCARYINS